MKFSWLIWIPLPIVTFISCADDEAGNDGTGGDGAAGASAGNAGESGPSGGEAGRPAAGAETGGAAGAGAASASAGSAGASGSAGSGGVDPCQRPAVVCTCDLRDSDGVCYEFHAPSFSSASCVPAICPGGDLLDGGCPETASVGYCVGGTTDRSEIYYDDAAAAETECDNTAGRWCSP